MNMHSVYMFLYERLAHIVTPIHLCMNEMKYEHVWSKGVCAEGLLTYMYTHTLMKYVNYACMMI